MPKIAKFGVAITKRAIYFMKLLYKKYTYERAILKIYCEMNGENFKFANQYLTHTNSIWP